MKSSSPGFKSLTVSIKIRPRSSSIASQFGGIRESAGRQELPAARTPLAREPMIF
jgi:hypothetical protein